jgi:hypothetical protein
MQKAIKAMNEICEGQGSIRKVHNTSLLIIAVNIISREGVFL